MKEAVSISLKRRFNYPEGSHLQAVFRSESACVVLPHNARQIDSIDRYRSF
jgi:hypothetical protein